MKHVVIDVCPDWIEAARSTDPSSPTVTYMTDDFWIATSDVWFFHGSRTGSLLTFDLSYDGFTLYPDHYSETPGYRGYGILSYDSFGLNQTYDYRLYPVVSQASVVPEPLTYSLITFVLLCLSFFRRRVSS